AEMLVDPAINLAAAGPRNVFYAYETADAVEEIEFTIDGIAMSDFVYPAWFEAFRKPGSAQFDYAKKVRRPFQILAGGYMSVFKNGKWTEIFGSRAKARRFRREDRRGHRSTYRGRTQRMRRSAASRNATTQSPAPNAPPPPPAIATNCSPEPRRSARV